MAISRVVGLGASAGGIGALKTLLTHLPPRTGAAYVVILHLSPSHDSKLDEVLQTATNVPVTKVHDRATVQSDHIYVVPPNATLTIADGELAVVAVTRTEQRRAPIDVFFRALAEAHGSNAVAVILSGTGPDGSSGLKRVKEYGGLVIAQDPAEAEYSDMPNNAIATGLVDYVLDAARIPQAIVEYYERAEKAPQIDPDRPLADADDAVREILRVLRTRTGHDFSNYKPGTIVRRITRRSHLHSLADLAEYARFIHDQPSEAAALMKDLLISVTAFFRDPEVYEAFGGAVVPRLFGRKMGHEHVRVWVAGCATGEEAYSIAILLAEYAASAVLPPTMQVFGTDLDQDAISAAREGWYTHADVIDVSEERLRRFFTADDGGYRVRRELRELVLFAPHNVIKDPPFSHLDLIACRNVLIYLNRAMQRRVLETFHFGLRPQGVLFLGTSETPDEGRDLFHPLDKGAHLYESRTVTSRALPPSSDGVGPLSAGPPSVRPAEPAIHDKIAPGDLHLRLLDAYAPPSVVVNEDFAVVHLSQRASGYLRIGGGEPSRDLMKLVWPELRPDLHAALHQARRERGEVHVRGIRSGRTGADVTVRVAVHPVLREGDPPRGFFLVIFDQETTTPRDVPEFQALEPSGVAVALEDELSRARGQLRATIEQYESQAEEATASHEELQALNEELRSGSEELETSKEELQSVNEELTTVNQELKIKIEELGLTNDDFRNFIDATDVATIFLDRSHRIKLFTPKAAELFHLRAADVGRQLTDIAHTLVHDAVREDIATVLNRLLPLEREVVTKGGGRYVMRILPYRTREERIDGVVMSFQDITERHRSEQRIRASEERLRLLTDSAMDYAIFTMDPGGRIESWGAGAERIFGHAASEAIGMRFEVLFTPEDRAAGAPADELLRALTSGRAEDERVHIRKDGTRFYVSGVTTRFGEGDAIGLARIGRDLTDQRRSQEMLQQAHNALEDRVQARTSELRAEVGRRTAAQEQSTSLMRRLVTAQEDQRATIARDLHDHLGQQLTALRLTLERVREVHAASLGTDSDIDRATALVGDINAAVDYLAWELRPAVLDDLGLAAALPRFVVAWSEHSRIPAEVRAAGGAAVPLPPEVEVTFYRVAQEALNNVSKHADASRVNVILENGDGTVSLVIEDDGIGFDVETARHGLGIHSMRERANLTGAELQIESASGKGTTVYLRFALKGAEGPGR